MKKIIGQFILWVFGWKVIGEVPKEPKYIGVIAPHTSLIDMVVGKCYNWVVGMEAKIIVKKEFFFFPLNLILKLWGGVPIDRSNPKGIVQQIVDMINESDTFILGLSPEGTRSATSEWKTGFYRIAVGANIPLYLHAIDFKKKEVGLLGEYKLTGNQDEDIKGIKKRYANIGAYHPEKFDIGEVE